MCSLSLLAIVSLSSAQAESSAESKLPSRSDEETLAEFYKKNPSRLMDRVFLPKPFMCVNSDWSNLLDVHNTGDPTGNPLVLRYQVNHSESDLWKDWQTRVAKEINSKFSKNSERADMDDRLLVVATTFTVNSDGKISDISFKPFCPADFRLMIVKTLQSLEGSPVLQFPEKKESIILGGKFSQNYGPKYIKSTSKP